MERQVRILLCSDLFVPFGSGDDLIFWILSKAK